jgi:hypothetical protein
MQSKGNFNMQELSFSPPLLSKEKKNLASPAKHLRARIYEIRVWVSKALSLNQDLLLSQEA